MFPYTTFDYNSQKGNVMTPLNWICGTCETLFLSTGALNYDNWYGVGSFVIAVGFIIFYGYQYNYFAKNDPNRLQTEAYNLDAQEIRLNVDSSDSVHVRTENVRSSIGTASYPALPNAGD